MFDRELRISILLFFINLRDFEPRENESILFNSNFNLSEKDVFLLSELSAFFIFFIIR